MIGPGDANEAEWGKPVFVLYGGVELPGAVPGSDVNDMLAGVLACLLA